MLSFARVIARDAAGLARVCGVGLAARWLVGIPVTLRACRERRDLQPADRWLGSGPFACRHVSGSRAKLVGPCSVSGIREIWVRDVYTKGGFLTLPTEGVVVDLGCNRGNFTMLALGRGPRVRAVSVDAETSMINDLRVQLECNGWQDRCTVVNAFVGGTEREQVAIEGRNAARVPHLTEEEFLRQTGLDQVERIEFLKCDIEGSEYELLTRESKLLAKTRQLTMEVHKAEGDAAGFYRMLEGLGFEVRVVRSCESDDIVQARRG